MNKIFIKKKLFSIALCSLAVLFVIFWWISKIESDDELRPQFILVSANTNLSKAVIDNNSHAINAEKKLTNTELISENKQEKIKSIEQPKEISHYLSSFRSELLLAADLQKKFDVDEIDSVAANEAERDLAYVFYQGNQWQEFVPQEISCKSNLCRVKVPLFSEEKNNKLTELISNEMKESNINYALAVPVKLPVEGFSYLYFVKGSLLGVLPRNN